MNGINILETIEVTVAPYETAALLFSFIMLMVFGGIVGYRAAGDKPISNREYKIGIGFVCVIFVTSILFGTYRVPTGVIQYKCTIDDTVTMGEVEEQYTILDVTVDESGDSVFLLEGK